MVTRPKVLALIGATAITPYRREDDCTLVLGEGKIAQMGRLRASQIPAGAERIDLRGHFVLPGFIDVHVHGGCGFDYADESPEAFATIDQLHAKHGTTSIMATIYPQPADRLFECLRRLRAYCETPEPNRITDGIHLEGPFLNPQMHGAIRPEYMWPPSVEAYRQLLEVGGPWVRVMTIAPELPGAMEVIRAASIEQAATTPTGKAARPSVHISIGHSNARYEQIAEAIDNGLDGVTHIFNAMGPIHHRKPGVLVGTLLRDELFVEVIADAVHVHPAVLQLLKKTKTPDRILLVTDAIRAAGQPDGTYDFAGQQVIVREGRAYLASAPQTLAGSTLTMDRAVKTMVAHAGVSLEQAAQMASLNAARILEWKFRRGLLAVGKDADIAVLDADLNVRMTIKAGHVVYRRDE